MNCANHPNEAAVATCPDCGKGLCQTCSSQFTRPICPDCNELRIAREKKKIYLSIVMTFVFGGFGVLPFMQMPLYNKILIFYIAACIPWGWRVLNRITPNIFLFMSWFGWAIYFILKISLSLFIGWFVLPIVVVKMVRNLVIVNKKQKAITQAKENIEDV